MPPTLLFDHSDRARLEISGAHAVPTLNGLVTNDVTTLKPGEGEYAAVLTPKGKMVADVRVLMLDGRLLLDTPALAADGLRAMLTKYVNPRFATLRDISATTADVCIVGPDAATLLGRFANVDAELLRALPVHGHLSMNRDSSDMIVLRGPAIGLNEWETYDLILPSELRLDATTTLRSLGAVNGNAETWNALRVEIGAPAWGVDMDESTLPQEANMDELHAVSYTKGCYVGQETVARIHFRGHVNRTLRRLSFAGDVIPPRGTPLLDADQKEVGDVRSAVHSAGAGAIGIGMVRRELDDGATVRARWDGEGSTTDVVVAGKAKGAID